jgi:hypothetical protein
MGVSMRERAEQLAEELALLARTPEDLNGLMRLMMKSASTPRGKCIGGVGEIWAICRGGLCRG